MFKHWLFFYNKRETKEMSQDRLCAVEHNEKYS